MGLSSYYYAAETKLYYLLSRYYDPAVGRFINPDIVFDTDTGFQGYNLYAYCGNDPVGRIDIGGTDSVKSEDVDLADDSLDLFGGGGSGVFSSPSGQSAWKLFWQSLKDGLGGLNGEFRGSPNVDILPKKCPNPNGRKGGAAHQNKINEIKEDLIARGYKVKTEHKVDSKGGAKDKRFIDVYGTKGYNSIGIQVGRQTKSGLPVARERYTLDDIISSGFNVIFIPYN